MARTALIWPLAGAPAEDAAPATTGTVIATRDLRPLGQILF